MPNASSRITEVEIDYQRQHACKPEMTIAPNEETIGKNITEVTSTNIIKSIFKNLSLTNKIDFLAFVIFNAAYITFNICYFLRLNSREVLK